MVGLQVGHLAMWVQVENERWVSSRHHGVDANDRAEGKSFQWVELWVVHPILCSVWKKKWPEVRIYQVSWTVANGLAGWSGARNEKDWMIGGMWVGVWEWAPRMTRKCDHGRKKASTMGKALNSQVDKNDVSQYLSSPDMMGTWVFKVVEIEVTRYNSLDCCLPKPIQLLPPRNIQLAGNQAQCWAPDMALFWSSRTATGTWDFAFLTRTQMMPLIPTMPLTMVYALQLEK